MHQFKIILPFLILFSLLSLLGYELFYANPNHLPSTLIGETVPSFSAPSIFKNNPALNEQTLKNKVSLLNIWATWCEACQIEHPMLMKIKNTYDIPIYSFIYKDTREKALKWLKENGNPFTAIGNDEKGDIAIDFGVYGTPETFIIDREGHIAYRHVGPINQQVWDETLYPLIKKLNG
jgi:cytochrome c biogenesis protein CcmG/thiol:disulfide interchange protein DsbE